MLEHKGYFGALEADEGSLATMHFTNPLSSTLAIYGDREWVIGFGKRRSE
jgi:hypothetical protein